MQSFYIVNLWDGQLDPNNEKVKITLEGTVQVRKLVDRESQEPLFIEFLKGDLVTLKTKFYYPIKVHSSKNVMVKKKFHLTNILLNKLLQ